MTKAITVGRQARRPIVCVESCRLESTPGASLRRESSREPVFMRRILLTVMVCIAAALSTGCAGRIFGEITSWQPSGDPRNGITYYVGGAGPMGNIGSFDVPGGMRDAGYEGDVRVYSWQSWLHAGDQLNIGRNREKGMELAERILDDRRAHPGVRINIIALSAGTGIATFALEFLPESAGVHNVVFLGCSLSSRYNLTRALARVKNKLYVVYSPSDGILGNVVWYTGTVDRSDSDDGIAGLEGFHMPYSSSGETSRQYSKVVNVRYRPEFALSSYDGGHMDSTSRVFIRRYVAPAIMNSDTRLVGHYPDRRFEIRRAPTRRTPPPVKAGVERDEDAADWTQDIGYRSERFGD